MARLNREAKKTRRNRIWMGAITIIIMVSGGLGIFAGELGPGENSMAYGDFMFENKPQGWKIEIDNQNMYFVYHPFEVDKYNLSQNATNMLSGASAIHLSNDPNSALALPVARSQDYLASYLYQYKGKIISNGFSVETQYEVPLITCDNATKDVPVILFEEGELEIVEEENCIHLNSPDEYGYGLLVDRVLYAIFGVI